ncbi:peptide-methionine (S)-S-oxide reductase MsrA [Pseudopedobacter beijingensis]|uniref:Peptide methionine sulfoxide reductase MsrA n=1 Tax=Pseudopedobacter beijingensis TaxID=1207056 RepID=A0ABW4IDE1_9SPHI
MKSYKNSYLLFLLIFTLQSCNGQSKSQKIKSTAINLTPPKGKAMAAFASGCFWCTEHVFESVFGVDSAVSGYAGGHTKNPTYQQVCTETTGHAETIMVYYDPQKVTYKELVQVFFDSHDPTTKNKQGPDVGSSYRSVLFYTNDAEKETAQEIIASLTKNKIYKKPIVTEMKPLKVFYRAEDEHQNFVKRNPLQPYVQGVSNPRFEKFKRQTSQRLKE